MIILLDSISHDNTTWRCEKFVAMMLIPGYFHLQYCSILMLFRKSPYGLHNSLSSFRTSVQVYKCPWPWRFPSLGQWCLGMYHFTPVSIWLPVELLFFFHHCNASVCIIASEKGSQWHTVDSYLFIVCTYWKNSNLCAISFLFFWQKWSWLMILSVLLELHRSIAVHSTQMQCSTGQPWHNQKSNKRLQAYSHTGTACCCESSRAWNPGLNWSASL